MEISMMDETEKLQQQLNAKEDQIESLAKTIDGLNERIIWLEEDVSRLKAKFGQDPLVDARNKCKRIWNLS
jgi:predicted nuclease with TOPRIM domain